MADMYPKAVSATVPNKEAQASLISLSDRILTEHKKFNDYYAKMEAVDVAYARYNATKDANGIVKMQGIDAATTPVGVMNLPSTTPPVVVSQVDSMVGYLAEVFLSGSPLFPIVSNPKNRNAAEALESLIDDHATIGGYARQLLMFLRDGVKYNFSAIEADWTSITQYTLMDDLINSDKPKLDKSATYYTKLNRWDPYNTVWDHNVSPGDVAADGDYAGHVQILSRTKLKRLLNRLGAEGEVINADKALGACIQTGAESYMNYRIHPQISEYISARKPLDGINYYEYITGIKEKEWHGASPVGNYELFTFYARIMPSDHRLYGTESRTPQIWKFRVINNSVLIQAKRIISAYDFLPVFFGQPLEDGLGYQTQSVAESNIPFQTAAATLVNIRFNAARRAVSDRALYDRDLISSADINAPVPAAKIPVKSNSLDATRKISDAYYPIPFDPRGTETTVQDANSIIAMGKDLSGLNNPMQGKFQKGNKSVVEWQDTMGGADSRLRLPALTLENQVFMPLKEVLKLNIYQYGQDAVTISQRSGKEYSVKIAEIREQVLAFRVADGYTPKSKLAGTDSLVQLMQLLGQSAPLQQAYGPMLPGMFSHLAQLMGVRGLEEYSPQPQQVQQNQQTAAAQSAGVDPATGQPINPADAAAANASNAQAVASLAQASQPQQGAAQ
jgi:hypothetical protein